MESVENSDTGIEYTFFEYKIDLLLVYAGVAYSWCL
jgi:hypothetical protein